MSFQSNVYPGESYHGLKHHEYDHNTRDVLGGGVRSTLIGSGGFDGDNLGDSLGLGSRLDGGFDLPGSNSFLSSSQIHSGAILKPDSYPKSGAYPKSHSKRNYIWGKMNVLKMYFMSYQDLSNDYFNYQIKYQNITLIYNMYIFSSFICIVNGIE